MTAQEFYAVIGGDYQDAVGRLFSDRLVLKFVGKFPADPTYTQLEEALSANDLETAFRAAHTLKGVAKNLSFVRLGDAASDLTEALRPGHEDQRTPEHIAALFAAVKTEYRAVLDAAAQL